MKNDKQIVAIENEIANINRMISRNTFRKEAIDRLRARRGKRQDEVHERSEFLDGINSWFID